MREKIYSLKYTWPILFLFLLVIGGMYAGFFTPTEAASIGAFGAILIVFAMGRLNMSGISNSIMESLRISGMLLILMVGAFIFAHFLALSRLPMLLPQYITGLAVSRYVVLLAIVLLYVVLGMFMEIFSSIVLTVPVIYPTVMALGFDPIWFGVLLVKLMEIGLITPPIGMNVFLLAGVTDTPMSDIFRGLVPFVLSDLVELALLIAFPQLALFLPGKMF